METQNLTLKELKALEPHLAKLAQAPLPASVGFRFRSFARHAYEQLRTLEESRQAMIAAYGTRDKDGSMIVPPEKREEFDREWEEVLKDTVELKHEKLSLKTLSKVHSFVAVDGRMEKIPYFSMLDFAMLDFMIVDDTNAGSVAEESKRVEKGEGT